MEGYRQFLAIWDLIKTLNQQFIFDYGIAIVEEGNYKIEFENDKQKLKHMQVFSLKGER